MGLCVFFFPLILQRISFVLKSGARLLSCTVCSLFSLCTKLTQSSPPHHPPKSEKKFHPCVIGYREIEHFLSLQKRKCSDVRIFFLLTHQGFVPDSSLHGCSSKSPLTMASKQLSAKSAPRVSVWPIMFLLVRFLLTLQTH